MFVEADVRALKAGTTIDDCFKVIAAIRRKHSLPIGILTYFNLPFRRGIDKFYRDCAKAGVTSVLIADLPLEHIDEVLGAAVEGAFRTEGHAGGAFRG